MVYLTESLVDGTKYKSIMNAYDRDEFSIVKYGGFYCIECRGLASKTYKLINKEMKRLFPHLAEVI